jgi:hypothetical protein
MASSASFVELISTKPNPREATGLAISDDGGRLAGARFREQRLEIRARGRKGQIADE